MAGIPPVQLLIHYDLNLIYQFWIHTEIINRLPFGLEYVFNTPSHHRVHHGRNAFCIDKNYAGVLIIWDRLFGTFQSEFEGEEKQDIAYGLVDNIQFFSPLRVQYHKLCAIFRQSYSSMNYSKTKLFFYGPGYTGAKDCPRLGDTAGIPEPEKPVRFYVSEEFENSWMLVVYAFLSELTLFSISEKAMAMHPALAWRVVYILFFIVNMESYSKVMETGRLDTGRQVGVNLLLIGFYYVFFGEFIPEFYVLMGLASLALAANFGKTQKNQKNQKKIRKPSSSSVKNR